MLDRVGDWMALNFTGMSLTGIGSLPGWVIALIGVVALCTFAPVRGGIKGIGALLARIAVALVLVLAGWWGFDYLARRDLAAERRALDARTFELATRALAPGSALACLDAIAGEVVEDSCEKALFASPEAIAAAVSYVAAQLTLLAAASDHAARGGVSSGMANLRRALEADRFGMVAHVLAVRDGCTPDQCGAFFLLRDASRISANLAERPFQSLLRSHMASWPTAGTRPVASINPPPAAASAAPVAGARVPNNLYFPSSASIPPVNIMTAEPAAQAPQASVPHDTTGAAEGATSPRKPAPGASQARQPPIPGTAAPTRAAPMQLAPNPQ
jgi:hypothetical protein